MDGLMYTFPILCPRSQHRETGRALTLLINLIRPKLQIQDPNTIDQLNLAEYKYTKGQCSSKRKYLI